VFQVVTESRSRKGLPEGRNKKPSRPSSTEVLRGEERVYSNKPEHLLETALDQKENGKKFPKGCWSSKLLF